MEHSSITEEMYEIALKRIEELLPLVDEKIPADDKNSVDLQEMSEIVIKYEKEHWPIDKNK